MISGGDWPPALRELASRAFGACTDVNRAAVSTELKALIFQAVQEGSLHTRDWSRVRLASLEGGDGAVAPKKRSAESGMNSMGHKDNNNNNNNNNGSSSNTTITRTQQAKMPRTRFDVREDPVRREMRQRRFEQEQVAFEREQQADMDSAIATTSLAGRLGAPSSSTASPLAHHIRTPMSSYANDTGAEPDPNVIDWDAHTVVGTSTKLEKPYLRLTSAPDPKTVRPLTTLRKTFEFLTRKWDTERNYAYICDQFKSMRQDLTVQRIKNEFTVQVYETHARIALEMGDLGEYNQCQSQLRSLYSYDLPGSHLEFLAYRILYLLHTRQQRDVNTLMSELDSAAKTAPAVAHALEVRAAMRCGNYHRFFALYHDAPNMNAYIMDHFVDRERVQALLILARALRPSCTLQFLASELGWAHVKDAHLFLSSLGAATYMDGETDDPRDDSLWDTKSANEPLLRASERFRKVDVCMERVSCVYETNEQFQIKGQL